MKKKQLDKKKYTNSFNFITILIVTFSLLFSLQSFSAGETGHSDLMRLAFEIFGFDNEMSQHLSAINQGVDNVPGSAATKSGIASEVLHFSRVITKSDLYTISRASRDVETDHHDFSSLTKILLIIKKIALGKAIGDSTGHISNAASVELLNNAIINGDLIGMGIGTHIALDAQGFHTGFKGALRVPLFGIDRLPGIGAVVSRLTTLPFGHLVEGTSVDRISVGKLFLVFHAMGDHLITMRNALGTTGVNHKWLAYLSEQKINGKPVDINDPMSIAAWFFNQPQIQTILQDSFPANKVQKHFDKVLEEVSENLIDLRFFRDKNQLQTLLKEVSEKRELFLSQVTKNTTYEQISLRYLIKQAIEKNLLNEELVIRETLTDLLAVPENKAHKKFRNYLSSRNNELLKSTKSIKEFIRNINWSDLPTYVQDELKKLNAELSTEVPFSEEWILDTIVEKISRNMIHLRYSKFNTAYLNETIEESWIKQERQTVVELEKVYFDLSEQSKKSAKYFYNPGKSHRSLVLEQLFKKETYEGLSSLEVVIKATDILIKTKLLEDSTINSISTLVKFKIFLKAVGFVFKKKISPITSTGGYYLKNANFKEMCVQFLKEEYDKRNPWDSNSLRNSSDIKMANGILTEEEFKKIKEYNDFINRKYNSDEAVGLTQKTALGIQKVAQATQNLIKGFQGKLTANNQSSALSTPTNTSVEIKCEMLFTR